MTMPISSEAVANAKSNIDRLGPEIEEWTNNFLELLDGVRNMDLVFQEAEGMDLNYVALCEWSEPSRLTILQTIPATQTAEQRNRTLATTSVIAALLQKFGHFDVAVALLANDVGKVFRCEGISGRCRATMGCSRISEAASQFDFSSIPGHVTRSSTPRAVLN
jgi:hypothetical protein